MSSIIIRTGVVLSGVMLLVSLGCSDARAPESSINLKTGKHVTLLWESPDAHGTAAKAAAAPNSGFAWCQDCHSDNFVGGIANLSCLNMAGCHGAGVNAPHSPSPWRGGTRTHANTDQSNAPVCAKCHTNGANSPVQPAPFDPGAAPGCFNNTLCHAVVGHSAIWENPFYHGAAAKSAPGAATGFSYCQTCHGNNFTGGVALQTCLNTAGCHGATVSAPHSPKPWRGGTRTHTDTDPDNAPVCATCHTNGANSSVHPSPFDPSATPGCFNNTLCHAAPGHAAGWELPAAHGAFAKVAPDAATTSGFSTCQTCHNTDFTGGISNKTCYLCHATAPHAPAPWRGTSGTSTHVNTDPANATVCAICHTNGANSTRKPSPFDSGAAPGCFNNTLCHASPTCGSCHAIPPNGATVPNQTGRHAVHDALANVTGVCDTCHSGAGINTSNHNNGTVNVAFVSIYNAKSGSAAYNAAGFTCSNVSCHGAQTTPSWLTGTINVNTQCTSCHRSRTASDQYNSYNSGQHSKHVSAGIACYQCHDTTLLAVNHFTHLNTTVMEGPANATIINTANYNGTSCSPGCHGNKNW